VLGHCSAISSRHRHRQGWVAAATCGPCSVLAERHEDGASVLVDLVNSQDHG
jgi:hypothetical protein